MLAGLCTDDNIHKGGLSARHSNSSKVCPLISTQQKPFILAYQTEATAKTKIQQRHPRFLHAAEVVEATRLGSFVTARSAQHLLSLTFPKRTGHWQARRKGTLQTEPRPSGLFLVTLNKTSGGSFSPRVGRSDQRAQGRAPHSFWPEYDTRLPARLPTSAPNEPDATAPHPQ